MSLPITHPLTQPNARRRLRLAQHLAWASPSPEAQALSAALLAARQQDEDAAWTLGACSAATSDAWCLLQLARICARQAEAAPTPTQRRQRHHAALRLIKQAGAVVHAAAADWDQDEVWLRCGASAALGSFVALCSSSRGGPAEAAAQLSQVRCARGGAWVAGATGGVGALRRC